MIELGLLAYLSTGVFLAHRQQRYCRMTSRKEPGFARFSMVVCFWGLLWVSYCLLKLLKKDRQE